MRRAPEQLAGGVYDLVVIGGGVHGAWAAWDAALRGLRVALVERGDFGGATSANSQKIVHGGLRYLQHGDLRRVRESIRERSTLLRLAPGLVRPLPVLVPTERRWRRGRAALLAAMAASDLAGLDRNRGLARGWRLPRGRLVSADVVREALGCAVEGATGAALFYDAQLMSPERLVLAVVSSAAGLGADVANYAAATELVVERGRVAGVRVADLVGGAELTVRARAVLNCAGPWASELAGGASERGPRGLVKAVALVTRPITKGAAVAVRAGGRNLFVTPWRGRSMVGTFYRAHDGAADGLRVGPDELDEYLAEANLAWPGPALERADVLHVHAGLLPAAERGLEPARRARLIDHGRDGGPSGAVSVIGVKWTTARGVAERAVDMVTRQLGRHSRGRTAETPLDNGAFEHLSDLTERLERREVPGLAPGSQRRLAERYGWPGERVLALMRTRPALAAPLGRSCEVTGAEVVYAAREEMALTLADVAFRRTDLADWGWPGEQALARAAALMGEDLGWDTPRREREVAGVRAVFERWGCGALGGMEREGAGERPGAAGPVLTGAA